MKLNRANRSKINYSLKKKVLNVKKEMNLFPLFIQITKKGTIPPSKKEEESLIFLKKKNLKNSNVNNVSNNNNIHSSSSLYINYLNANNNTKSKKDSNINNMILTSADNSSISGSKEKILSYNQNNNPKLLINQSHHKKQKIINNIIWNGGGGGKNDSKKNSKGKKYPMTSFHSRKNSIDKKKNISLLKKYQQFSNKNSINLNSNRNKFIQNTNICSNKNLLPNSNQNNHNNKINYGFSFFNNYIKNSLIQNNQKNMNKKNKICSQNVTHFFSNNKLKNFTNKNIINKFKSLKNPSYTAKSSPRSSFITTYSKSSKIINNSKTAKDGNKTINNIINSRSKINEMIKNINIIKIHKKNKSNNIFDNINKSSNNITKNKINNNYNSFNNFYNNFILNNNMNNNNINNNISNINNSNYCNNFENILNNCQTTSGPFYNNYNININNQINNHIIYNNNNKNTNNNSRKKLNNMNFIKKNYNKIISQSQNEILQIKKISNRQFCSNNSPNRIINYKIISCKKPKSNKHANNLKKTHFLNFLNHFSNESYNKTHKIKLKNKNSKNMYNKLFKYQGMRNGEKKRKNSKIKSKSTEKFQVKSLKNELIIDDKKYNNNEDSKRNSKVKSCGKLEIKNIKKNDMINLINVHKSNNYNNKEIVKNNIYMNESISLSKFIKSYYQKNNEYPQTNLNFYKFGRLIGQGAFGKVNLGLNVLTGRVVAIKSFNKRNLDSPNNENMRKILYETNLMKKLNHKYITKILEMFEDEQYILIIMEYINGGNLFSFVKKRRKLSEKISRFLFRQIILGLKYIHSQNIVHRDIKLENILIDLNNTIKICDFGIGKILSSPDELLYDQCGTPMYMAPEILKCNKDHGYKGFPVDIWSAGIALYIMLSGVLPFSVKNEIDSFLGDKRDKNQERSLALRNAIIHNEPKKIKKISKYAQDLLNGLLNKDPNNRLTCDEILNHPWFKVEEIENNNNYHLFTNAEMIILSRTYIDYRQANMDDLIENFTLSNLKRDKKANRNEQNVTTKSFILTPYNTLLYDENSMIDGNVAVNQSSITGESIPAMKKGKSPVYGGSAVEENEESELSEFDDFNNSNIHLENELISLNNKVKEFNMLYELNNNKEVDNGMVINSKVNTLSSISLTNKLINNNSIMKTESVICYEEKGNKVDYNENYEHRIKNKYEIPDNDKKKDNIDKKEMILNKIEDFGYDKEYVKKCLDDNILCHATSIYFLLMNYDNI